MSEGDNRTKATLRFDISDAPMLFHAMVIARNTAWMSGRHMAKERLERYKAMIAEVMPPITNRFDEEGWAEMGMTLCTAPSFRVHFVKGHSWDKMARCMITTGEQTWGSRREDFDPNSADAEAVFEALQQIAPLDCEGVLDRVPSFEANHLWAYR